MSEQNYTLPSLEAVTISGRDADSLIAERDALAALLYLFLLRTRGEATAGAAASALGVSEEQVNRSLNVLGRLGLVRTRGKAAPAPEKPRQLPRRDEPPEYTAADIKNELDSGAVFSALVSEVQSSLGKVLSSDDLIRLFGIYDHLGLPPEVVLQLITYCIHENARRYGPGRLPTMRYIEKAAYTWEREGVLTLPMAEEYIRRIEAQNERIGEYRRALGITGRELTASERKYADAWIEKGFPPEAVEIAYDRTVLKTGKLAWGYMDSIISSWHNKGLHTPQEIEEKDTKPPRARPAGNAGGAPGGPTAAELERMNRMLERIKGEGK